MRFHFKSTTARDARPVGTLWLKMSLLRLNDGLRHFTIGFDKTEDGELSIIWETGHSSPYPEGPPITQAEAEEIAGKAADLLDELALTLRTCPTHAVMSDLQR